MCHGSVSVSWAQHGAAGEVLQCCRAGAQRDVNLAWSGSVPSLLGTQCPWQEPTRHGDPGRSPLRSWQQLFLPLPTDAWAPASDSGLSLPPSFPPALLPGWDQRSQQCCRGSRSGAPGTATTPRAWPGTATRLGRPPPCRQTGSVRKQWRPGHPPKDSAMPGLRHEMRQGR